MAQVILARIMCFVSFRVFGPVFNNETVLAWIHFDYENWNFFAQVCFGLAMVLVPCFKEVRAVWHLYYLRSLQKCFFKNGEDRLLSDAAINLYCPLILLTGTANDFKKLGCEDSISEISLSPLHIGGTRCGYICTSSQQSLAQAAALSGAGCLDSLSLSLHDRLRSRFWLELLNLSWGNYILFANQGCKMRWHAPPHSRSRSRSTSCHDLTWLPGRLPAMLLWFLVYLLQVLGFGFSREGSGSSCRIAGRLLLSGNTLAFLMISLSFYAFAPKLHFLMFSAAIRQLHQATQFHYRGERPPRMLYVTDGGVKDCTTIVQLMRRKCERILLVLAAFDPEDELGVLLAAMSQAAEEKLGSFYDPQDPCRDVRILFEEFKTNQHIPYLHIGILYGWGDTHLQRQHAQLYVVKNRMPPALKGQSIRPLLTEEEIQGSASSDESDEGISWSHLREVDLGGYGCCDCCHTQGLNCGRKFPHLTFTGYLYLTPRLFSSLCRLGYTTSAPAVQAALCPKTAPA